MSRIPGSPAAHVPPSCSWCGPWGANVLAPRITGHASLHLWTHASPSAAHACMPVCTYVSTSVHVYVCGLRSAGGGDSTEDDATQTSRAQASERPRTRRQS